MLSGWSQQHCCLKAVSLKTVPTIFKGRACILKTESGREAVFALIQLSGKPVVMSAWFSLLATSLIANPFRVLLTGVSRISWICMSTSLLRFGKILTIISSFFLLLLGFTWCIYGSIWWWSQSALGCLYFSSFIFFSFLPCKKQTKKKQLLQLNALPLSYTHPPKNVWKLCLQVHLISSSDFLPLLLSPFIELFNLDIYSTLKF